MNRVLNVNKKYYFIIFLTSFFVNSGVILKTAQRRKEKSTKILFDDIALGDLFFKIWRKNNRCPKKKNV